MFIKIILPILAVIFIIYIFLIAPKLKKRLDKSFLDVKYAHRGLHGKGAPENSMKAFELAVQNGYGIELDVRFSKDGHLMVFHDATLERVCGIDARVCDKTKDELSGISLDGTDQTVPSFDEVLALVDGKVPLLVEIKQEIGEGDVASAVCRTLSRYSGAYIVETFNPLALAKVKKLLPDARRGLLCDRFTTQKKYQKPLYYLLQAFVLNFLCKPDFIAYNHKAKQGFSYKIVKNVFKTPLVAWTVRSKADEAQAKRDGFKTVIFENYEA